MKAEEEEGDGADLRMQYGSARRDRGRNTYEERKEGKHNNTLKRKDRDPTTDTEHR